MSPKKRWELFQVLVDVDPRLSTYVDSNCLPQHFEAYQQFEKERGHETIIQTAQELVDAGQGHTVCIAVRHQTNKILSAKGWTDPDLRFPVRWNAAELVYARSRAVLQWLLEVLEACTSLPVSREAILSAATAFWKKNNEDAKETLERAQEDYSNHGGSLISRFHDATGEKAVPLRDDVELRAKPLPPKSSGTDRVGAPVEELDAKDVHIILSDKANRMLEYLKDKGRGVRVVYDDVQGGLNMSRSTVSKGKAELLEKGLIVGHKGGGFCLK